MSIERDVVIVVSGLPRAGTSLLMQLLAAAGVPLLEDGRRPADEDNPRGYHEYEPVKRTRHDASWVRDARGKAVKVVCALLPDLPASEHYRVVFAQRALDEVVASQERMLARRGIRRDGRPASAWIEAFERELASAHAWLAAHPEAASLEVPYRELVLDPGPQLARLEAFLGLELGLEAARVVDGDLYRFRSPVIP